MKKYALMFSGQGSERVGMFNDMLKEPTALNQILDELKTHLNVDMRDAVMTKDAAVVAANNQVLLGIFHHLMSKLVIEKIGYPPSLCMGHSFGQFSALVSAAVTPFADMIQLIIERTRIINCPQIEVKALFKSLHGITFEAFEQLYAEENLQGDVEPGLHNQKEQIVCAATKSGEEKLNELCGKYNFVIKDVNVSRPYHTPFMEEFNNMFLPHIEEMNFAKPKYPVVLNHSKKAFYDGDLIKEETRIQMIKTVFWYDSVLLAANEVEAFVIIDPSETQFKMLKRITDKKIHNVNSFGVVKLIEKRGI